MEKKGKINIYECDNRHKTVTINRNNGVTPFVIGCPICGFDSRSHFYHVNQNHTPTHEWYKPGFFERLKLSKHERCHVKMGGLLLRKINKLIQPAFKI